jgi:hypothetical protein
MSWDAAKQERLVTELYGLAGQIRQLTVDCYILLSRFEANAVADDPAFTDARGVSKEDTLAMIGVIRDVVYLIRNGPVTQADREAVLSRMTAGTLT